MNLAILTTDTLHHCCFVRDICRRFSNVEVFEQPTAQTPIASLHALDQKRERYEQLLWFNGEHPRLRDFCDPRPLSAKCLRGWNPASTIVFGTRILPKEIIECCGTILNLHGGDPERYRGLDSHLWAIYHHDWGSLCVTLHRLVEDVDAGAIVKQASVPLRYYMGLHQLRAATTEICALLMSDWFTETVHIEPRAQDARDARYYGRFPDELKNVVAGRFFRHTSRL